MEPKESSGTPLGEIAAYRGRGARGWTVEPHQELVSLDPGRPFGGEWPARQVWEILSGEGALSWETPFRRIRVAPGDRYRFEAGERRLLRADTAMRILITRVE